MGDVQILNLTNDDVARLSAQRKWVLDHYDDHQRAESVEGKLRLLNVILSEGWIEPHETVKLQSLGVVLGDALAQELSLTWRIVSDEYGRDPALILDGTTLRLFPLTMISKRIEKGEQVDVVEMFGGVCSQVRTIERQFAQHAAKAKSGQVQ